MGRIISVAAEVRDRTRSRLNVLGVSIHRRVAHCARLSASGLTAVGGEGEAPAPIAAHSLHKAAHTLCAGRVRNRAAGSGIAIAVRSHSRHDGYRLAALQEVRPAPLPSIESPPGEPIV